MKIRNGFVSNSSSSSFLIAFNKMPESREEIKNFFFKDCDESDRVKGYQRSLSIKETVDVIWRRITDDSKVFTSINAFTYEDIEHNFDDIGWDEVSRELAARGLSDDSPEYWKEHTKLYREKHMRYFNNYMKPYVESHFFENGGVMVEIEFSDESGYPDSIIEHSSFFRDVPCKICSHH